MQTTQQPGTPQADPGFKLPADAAKPDEALPKTTPPTATEPVEIAPGVATPVQGAPATDTSTRDLAIGGAAFLILLV
ncbi:MAG: hypothetical protein ACJ8LG_19450, partial [Massilia sp.]